MRKDKLWKHYQAGGIPQGAWNYYLEQDGTDYDGLAEYANKVLGLKDVPIYEDYEKQRQEEYANYRATSQEVFDKQSLWGKVGQFAGQGHAMAIDPLYAVSFFTGYGAANTVLQAAVRVGLTEAAIETVAQPFVKSWKDEVGADYSGADMLTNIVLAGTGAGIIAGAGKGLSTVLVKDATKHLNKSNDPALNPIKHVIDQHDGEENLLKVLRGDEGVDIQSNNLTPKTDASIGFDLRSAEEVLAMQEELFRQRVAKTTAERQAVIDANAKGEAPKDKKVVGTERVEPVIKNVTPEMHDAIQTPLVRQSIDEVEVLDNNIKLMEECF